MSSSFDKKLEAILKSDNAEKMVDDLPDEDEDQQEPEEMLPVEYDKKETSIQLNNKDLQDDYEYARSNLYGLIGRSNAALELTLKIAMMSEHPRALEVAANLIKTSSDISKELISLHKSIEQKSQGGTPPKEGQYTQINNYYSDKEKAEQTIDDLPDEETKDEGKGE